MPEERNNPALKEVTDYTPGAAQRPRSRKLPFWLVIFALVLVLLGLAFMYAPRYVARYLIASELERLGLAYEGVETLDIHLWAGEVWIGPVSFGAGGSSDPAKLAELGLDMRLTQLLKQRVSIERLLVRGIDLVVTRKRDDGIALNGIALAQLMRHLAAEEGREQSATWEGGVDVLELRDSRLIFEDRGRGVLEVVIEQIRIMDLRTWEPNQPARFELVARVNDIQLNWSGEVRPFADEITVSVDARTQQADLPKLIRFTGPLGLDRRQGTYDAELQYQASLSGSGRLEGQVTGTIEIGGADYQRAGVFGLVLERAKVELDLSYILDASGDFSLQGQLVADLAKGNVSVAEETRFGARKGRLAISGMDFYYDKDDRIKVAARPQVDLEVVTFSGPVEVSVDSLLALLALLQSLSAGVDLTIADTGLGDLAGRSLTVPSSDITLSGLRIQAESFSLASDEGQLRLGLQTSSELSDINIVAGESEIKIESLQSALQQFTLESGKGQLSLEMVGSNSLLAGSGVSPIGDLRISALEAQADALNLQVQTGAAAVELAASIRAEVASSRINPRKGLPEARFQLDSASVVLSRSAIDMLDGVVHWQLAGDAGLDALSADFAQGEDGAVSFGHAQIKALQANDQSRFAADVLNVEGLDLYFKRSLLQALLDIGKEPTDQAVAEETESATSTTAPVPGTSEQQLDVRRIQALLSELGYNPGPLDGLMGRRTAAAIKAFQDREGLLVNARPTAALLAALESRAAGTAASATEPADQVASDSSSFRLGQMAFTGNSVIRFRDDVITPNVNVDAVFKQAQVNNLDSRKTKQRSKVSIAADINEFTQAELQGWTNGLSRNADFDLNAKVMNLALSTYSPYIEALAQFSVESGRLDTRVAGSAAQGALQGEIQLDLDKLSFRPLSEEGAERMTNKLGVPLDTAVTLLQDTEGRIALKLPLRGTVSKPDVDISSAMDKAIGGALREVFPPFMVASLMSSLLQGEDASFEPIGFAPGSAELDSTGRRYADSLAEFLAEHPKLSMDICGRSTAQDMGKIAAPADTQAPAAAKPKSKAEAAEAGPADEPFAGSAQEAQLLDELAIERMRAVRRYLVNQKGMDAERIGECNSSFEADDQGDPRVEVFL